MGGYGKKLEVLRKRLASALRFLESGEDEEVDQLDDKVEEIIRFACS